MMDEEQQMQEAVRQDQAPKDEFNFDDRTQSIFAMIFAISNRLVQCALKRKMSDGIKQEIKSHLNSIADTIDKL